MHLATSLNKIREQHPCQGGWGRLLKYLNKTRADDEPLPFAIIIEAVGLDEALWCCRAAPEHDRHWRLFAVWCAKQGMHLITDPRCLTAIEVAERHAYGGATDAELGAARVAAEAAVWDASRDAGEFPSRLEVAHAARAAWGAAGEFAGSAAEAAARGAQQGGVTLSSLVETLKRLCNNEGFSMDNILRPEAAYDLHKSPTANERMNAYGLV